MTKHSKPDGGPYYAENGTIWKRPIETDNGDGTRGITIGFPVCTMHPACGDDQAKIVAALMNAGHAAPDPRSNQEEGDG